MIPIFPNISFSIFVFKSLRVVLSLFCLTIKSLTFFCLHVLNHFLQSFTFKAIGFSVQIFILLLAASIVCSQCKPLGVHIINKSILICLLLCANNKSFKFLNFSRSRLIFFYKILLLHN